MTHPSSQTTLPTPQPKADAQTSAAKLDLLLPQDLPVEATLDPAEQIQLRAILSGILHALALPEQGERLSQLSHLLATLDDVTPDTAQFDATGIPAKPEQVNDFDRYFNVNRVTSNAPAWPMVRGHLQTCVAVLALAQQSHALPAKHLARQVDGFIEYTNVLSRTFQVADPI